MDVFCYIRYNEDIIHLLYFYISMNEFKALYEFIDLAQKNRKYPINTAQGRRASLKLFETVLHADELESLSLIEERMKEIYLSLISSHKDRFSIQSLNTYKSRFLKVVQDYKKYGVDAQSIAKWEVKNRKSKVKGDKIDNKIDSKKDENLSSLSLSINRSVHKIQISLDDNKVCSLELPTRISKKDVSVIIKIINSFSD